MMPLNSSKWKITTGFYWVQRPTGQKETQVEDQMDCGSSKALGEEVWSQTTGHICQALKKIEMQDQSRSTLQILTFVTYFYFWCTSFWRHFSLFSLFFKQDNLIFQYTHLPPSKETQWQYHWNMEDFNKNRLNEPTYGKQTI